MSKRVPKASVRVMNRPDIAPGAKRFEVECPASTTGLTHAPGPTDMSDDVLVTMAASAHQGRCGRCDVSDLLDRGMAELGPSDPDQAEQQIAEMLATSLPVAETTIRPFGGMRIPVVSVKVDQRPDVRDMLRVLREDRDGEMSGGWGIAVSKDRVWLVFDADITRPARCSFQVAFDYRRHRKFLESATKAALLGVAVEPFRYRDGKMMTPSIGLTYDPTHLAEILSAVKFGHTLRGERQR
jgi:hypothetical protein